MRYYAHKSSGKSQTSTHGKNALQQKRYILPLKKQEMQEMVGEEMHYCTTNAVTKEANVKESAINTKKRGGSY